MNKKMLRKDFFMEIKTSLGRFLSIFFIVAIGVAFFSGIRSSEPDMRLSGDSYFDKQNLHDIKVISTLGLTDDDKEALLELDAVDKVEHGYSVDALCTVNDSKTAMHIMSIQDTMNKLVVEEGRLPENNSECVVDAAFVENNGYKIGDTITFISGTENELKDTLVNTTFTIVGLVSSPQYISFGRGNTTIGTGHISGFVCVDEDAFDMDVYTELYVRIKDAENATEFTKEYDNIISDGKEEINGIKEERQTARYNEIVHEATVKLDEAKQDLEDGKNEAEAELSKALKQLEDGKREINNGWAQVNSGAEEIKRNRVDLANKRTQIEEGMTKLPEAKAQLDEGYKALEEAKQQLEQLKISGMADEQTIAAMEAGITEKENELNAGYATYEQSKAELEGGLSKIESGLALLDDKESELATAKNTLHKSQKELDKGYEEYYKAKEDADLEIADGEKKIREAEEEIEKIENAKWYIDDRSDLPDHGTYGENADRMKAIGKVFPVLFFLVAALISLTTMTRMVEDERVQIGTLKALGYSRRSIAGKYLGYAGLATLGGSIIGVLIGEKILPFIIIFAYGIMFPYVHEMIIPYNMYYGIMAGAAAFGCTMIATYFSCNKEMKEQAAQLMRPPSPKQGKRVFMERITFVWKHLSFIWKATVRNLIRYKKRFFMTVFGIGGCMALLLVGFGIQDSISNIAVLQFNEIQTYDASVILESDATDEEKLEIKTALKEDERVDNTIDTLLKNVTLKNGNNKREAYLNVPLDLEAFDDFVSFRDRITKEEYEFNDDGIILTEKTADMLDVKAGDIITIKDDIKGEIDVKVSAICENYLGHYIYMTPGLYNNLYGKDVEANSIYYTMKDDQKEQMENVGEEVLQYDGALSISYTKSLKSQIDNMLGSLDIVIIVLVISAGMLAFVVLYNLNNINITERQRELATLKVLGFYDTEVGAYVYRENVILSIIGALFGCLLGKFLHGFVIKTVEVESAMFGRNIDFSSFIYGFIITIGFSLFVNFVMYFKLKKIDMVESLKSVE